MKEPARILMVAEAVTFAHVARILSLSKVIETLYPKAKLFFAFDNRYADLIPSGLIPIPLWSIDSQKFLKAVNSNHFPYSETDLQKYVCDEIDLLERLRPQLVIGDFRITLAISCRKMKIPYIAVTNSYWLPELSKGSEPPNVKILSFFPKRFAKFLFRMVSPMVYAFEAAPFNRVARFFLEPDLGGSLLKVYTQGDFQFLVEPPHWTFLSESETRKCIGPLGWNPKEVALPNWWEELDWSFPTILISVGSSGANEMVDLVLSAVENLGFQVLIAGGAHPKRQYQGVKIHQHFFLPLGLVLSKAHLFVFNGGSLSMVESLKNGCPMIGIASNYDQLLNLSVLTEKGLGVGHSMGKVKIKNLRDDILRLISQSDTTKRDLAEAQTIFMQPPQADKIRDIIDCVLAFDRESRHLEA